MSDEDREKWNERYRRAREQGATTSEPMSPQPTAFLAELDAVLPERGRALDVAGGSGRHALWLLRRGLAVDLVDVSEEGLALARELAAREGLASRLATHARDLPGEPLPPGPYQLVLCTYYLERALFPALGERVAPDGLLVYVHPTRRNLERHGRPPAAFLLEEGELGPLVTERAGLRLLRYDEGWTAEGRHEARVLAAPLARAATS